MGMGRGQAAVEFIFIFIVLLVAVNLAAVFAFQRAGETQTLQRDIEAGALVVSIAGSVNTAFLAGDGFRMNITLPATVGNQNYTFLVSGSQLILNTTKDTYSAGLYTANVSGTFHSGLVNIKNVNNTLIIT